VNQATSDVERAISSSHEPMPCCRMKRVRWLRSMVSGVGRQTISPPKVNLSVIMRIIVPYLG